MRSAIQGYLTSTLADQQLFFDEGDVHAGPLAEIEKALVDKADGKVSNFAMSSQ